MKPWINRQELIDQARCFVQSHGFFLNRYSRRISSLVEIAVYNSVVSYYGQCGHQLKAMNLGPKKSFRYKISSTGHAKNFSYFEATDSRSGSVTAIFHNTKIQSAHHDHLYYTPDIAVCSKEGNITVNLKGGRKHSFIQNKHLFFFVEVKHLLPFPEALFSFTGLVQEFMPVFIAHTVTLDNAQTLLSPMLVFTGVPSENSETIRKELISRYGINIVYGTQKTNGQITDFSELKKYKPS